MRTRRDPALRLQMLRLFEQGVTYRQLEERFGIPKGSVSTMLRLARAGTPPGASSYRHDDERIARVMAAVKEGYTYAQAGRRVGGLNKNQVAGLLYRARHAEELAQANAKLDERGYWTEEKLTERWSDRKARLAAGHGGRGGW